MYKILTTKYGVENQGKKVTLGELQKLDTEHEINSFILRVGNLLDIVLYNNSVIENALEVIAPEPGQGGCIYGYCDRNPVTVVAVSKSGRQVKFQRADAVLLNGPDSGREDALKFVAGGFLGRMTGKQVYEFTPNPNASIQTATLCKNGFYYIGGMKGSRVSFDGYKYYDYGY